MLPLIRSGSAEENTAKLAALDKVQAVIEFAPDGTILTANRNFLDAMGYALEEVRGRHHGMFVEPAHRESQEYRQFWAKLGRGEFQAGQFKRFGKGGKEVWIEASYNPIRDRRGKPVKIVKYAIDVTGQKMAFADLRGQVEAIHKSQAVIEFELDGTILTANRNFLDAVGYALEEIRGRHHGMFVEPAHRESQEYRRFWAKLGEGEFQAGQFKRFGKGGKEVWIEASYNPIRDLNGRPFKVVKFATDITARKLADADVQSQMAAIGKSQSVIQFALDGTILTANRKFLDALGYSLRSAIPSTRSRAGTTASSWTRKPPGAPSTKRSGGGCARASSTRGSTAASARTRRPSGSRRPTTRCSTRTASWSRSSNSPAT